MGRGRSKAGGGGSSGGGKINTPSGVSYQQFMKMSDSQKQGLMRQIINDPNIQVPGYLDSSDTTKVLYALGMNQKPTIVSDSQLDSIQGIEIYRTVYETGSMPPPSSSMVLDQIRNGDFTQMSGKGGSAHGRAIYFATNFGDSSTYGMGENNSLVMRAKINPKANIRSEKSLRSQIANDPNWGGGNTRHDDIALYAVSHGIDGWYSGSYTMMVNRGVLTASSTNKAITQKLGRGGKLPKRASSTNPYATSWTEAATKT